MWQSMQRNLIYASRWKAQRNSYLIPQLISYCQNIQWQPNCQQKNLKNFKDLFFKHERSQE